MFTNMHQLRKAIDTAWFALQRASQKRGDTDRAFDRALEAETENERNHVRMGRSFGDNYTLSQQGRIRGLLLNRVARALAEPQAVPVNWADLARLQSSYVQAMALAELLRNRLEPSELEAIAPMIDFDYAEHSHGSFPKAAT